MATLFCWHTLCGWFWAVMAEWNNCDKDCLACKASSIFYVAFYWGPLFWKVSQYLWFHSMGIEPWAVWLPSPVPYATKASTGVREGTFGQSGVEKSFQPGLIPPRCHTGSIVRRMKGWESETLALESGHSLIFSLGLSFPHSVTRSSHYISNYQTLTHIRIT